MKIQKADTVFSFSGDSYHAQEWKAKYVPSSDTELKDTEFEVRTRHKGSKSLPEVSCWIADGQSPNTVEPLYKHTVGNCICMLIRGVCLCRGTVLAHLKKSGFESQCL